MPTVPPITQNFSRPSYRPDAQSGLDPDIKRMALIAGGLGALVAVVIAAFSLAPHAHHGVPVLEVVGPVRVKPLDPGGMKVAGSEDAVSGVEALAPAAEKPAIRALRAKSHIQPAAARPLAAAAPGPIAHVAAAKPGIVAAPVQKVLATQVAPVPAPAHGIVIQLAAFENQQAAEQDWGKLAERIPGLFDGHRPEVQRTQLAGHTVYRLRTGGFASGEAASTFCGKVRAKGGDCSVSVSTG